MQQVLNTAGSVSQFETSWEDGGSQKPFRDFGEQKSLIQKANSLPLASIFEYYKIDCGEHNKKICCPFRSHNGGKESTPSFLFYPTTNSFFCFGCKAGIKACDFVAEYEEIERHEAAQRILDLFDGDAGEFMEPEAYEDKLKIMMEFSNVVRDVMQSMPFKVVKIEKICKAYDDLNQKHNLNANALKSVTDKLLARIQKLSK